jgi:hypothetical protein
VMVAAALSPHPRDLKPEAQLHCSAPCRASRYRQRHNPRASGGVFVLVLLLEPQHGVINPGGIDRPLIQLEFQLAPTLLFPQVRVLVIHFDASWSAASPIDGA